LRIDTVALGTGVFVRLVITKPLTVYVLDLDGAVGDDAAGVDGEVPPHATEARMIDNQNRFTASSEE
jgi:hypothetical protein